MPILYVDSASFKSVDVTGSIFLNGTALSTTASSTFPYTGSAIISGSLVITGSLSVLGPTTFTTITSSQLNVATNVISVNVFEPAQRFGGLVVYDSGSLSHLATSSLLWDSLNNKWIYQNASGSTYNGGMLLSGPRNFGALGDEPSLVTNYIVKSQGGDHITTSSIFDNGTYVSVYSNTQVTGALDINGSLSLNGSAITPGGGGTFASRFIIHNGEGSTTAITTGIKYTTTVIADKGSTITGWKIFCNPSSSLTLDVLKANKSKPTATNSITGSAAPSITNNQYAESTTLTGWTTSVVAGDILVLNVVSNTAASYIQLELTQQ